MFHYFPFLSFYSFLLSILLSTVQINVAMNLLIQLILMIGVNSSFAFQAFKIIVKFSSTDGWVDWLSYSSICLCSAMMVSSWCLSFLSCCQSWLYLISPSLWIINWFSLYVSWLRNSVCLLRLVNDRTVLRWIINHLIFVDHLDFRRWSLYLNCVLGS